MSLSEMDIEQLLELVEARRRRLRLPDAPNVVTMCFELFGMIDFDAKHFVIVAADCARRDKVLMPLAELVLRVLGHEVRAYSPTEYRIGDVRLEFVTAREAGLNARRRVTVGRYKRATVATDPILEQPGSLPRSAPQQIPNPLRHGKIAVTAPRTPPTTRSR